MPPQFCPMSCISIYKNKENIMKTQFGVRNTLGIREALFGIPVLIQEQKA